MKHLKSLILTGAALATMMGCENRDINEGEQFKPREIHEDIMVHFDKITVDGIEYLILEKDNNNPHEGFGFMAFRANKLMEKQDSLLAHMRTIQELQIKTLAAVSRRSVEDVTAETEEIFLRYLNIEQDELNQLEQNNLKSDSRTNSLGDTEEE
ncbi:hypothetical protein [Marinoscillum furvescens]|uniref:Uncharacterized protein n=1 Tax=Marinoscillum furvescens DSM 4134 TaxID=1122208 RepID=A0A3D9L908_MARFU|nr:hypothetical protein [Marinoscillum furvescens]REE02156.1 hypothetical protein C7460_102180 [Marinoscillum furvescens DSM 4134]